MTYEKVLKEHKELSTKNLIFRKPIFPQKQRQNALWINKMEIFVASRPALQEMDVLQAES